MDYSSLLNKDQLAAVSTDSKYTRIVAGAGSGKTRVLTYRIAYLISELNVDPSSILAIAFTNKVANEMKDRVIKLLPNVSQFLHISTFHSFGVSFLRNEIHHLGLSPSFTIFDDDDSQRLIKEICVEKGYSKKDSIISEAFNYISSKKCKGLYPKNVILSNYHNEEELLDIYKIYEHKKTEMIALDFDDLLLLPIIILENYPEVKAKWNNRIKHILIDEFQDTNDVQFKLVKLLVNDETFVYVVGDPDQTIYTWRGANQKIILNFSSTFKNAKTIILDQNYRSTKTILDAANKIISNNKKRVPKDLYTNNLHGEKIELFKGATKDVEAEFIVQKISQLKNRKKIDSLRDVAVLYRSSYLTLPLEKALIKERIKYRVFGGVRFYQRAEIKDALAYFRLLINPKDDISFLRIINVPKRKIGDKSIDIIRSESLNNGLSIYEYIKNIHNYSSNLSPTVILSLFNLVSKMEEVKIKLNEDDGEIYSKILEDFLIDIGYYIHLEQEDNADERIGNLKTLFSDMVDFIKKNPEDGFSTWLENCTLATSQDDMKDDDYVSLMTVHTAKGLEYNYVFIMGLADSVFPNQRAIDEEGENGLEEERRLCYVAFTRAKTQLYLTMNNGYSFVLEGNPVESRFIKEAGLSMPSDPSFSKYGGQSQRIKNPNFSFDDMTFFNGDDEIKIKTQIKTNGITDWKVGDLVNHDKFGDGLVTKIISEEIIEIDFNKSGRKQMVANHYMIKRVSKIEDMN